MTDTLQKRGDDLLRKVWADLQRAGQQRELDEIKADPARHRLTRIMAKGAGTNYSYWPGSTRRLSKQREDRIWFCHTKHRNAAGVYLMWRQVNHYRLTKGRWTWHAAERSDFQWTDSKPEARNIMASKATRDRDEWAAKCAMKLPDAPAEVRKSVDDAIAALAGRPS